MNRREFSKEMLTTVYGFALLQTFFSSNALSKSIQPITNQWLLRLNEYCFDLKKTAITPLEWQSKIELLYKEIELKEILKTIDFNNLIKGFDYPDLGVNTRLVKFPKLEGLPEKTVFIKKIFGLKKDRAIIPHGHSNMASAHLILKGEMHLRHYEKVYQEKQHLIIKPTIDKQIALGDASSISDQKDNIHWFIATTPTAFTFDVIMLDLNEKSYDIHNLDMYKKQDAKNGTLRVPIMNMEEALKKYGKISHH